jgi:hypothetical protein
MPTPEKNNNFANLFVNNKKLSDKHPDYQGDALVEGKEYFASCWIKTDKNGHEYLSLSLTPKPIRQTQGATTPPLRRPAPAQTAPAPPAPKSPPPPAPEDEPVDVPDFS